MSEVVDTEQDARDERRQDQGDPSPAILQQSLRDTPYHGPTYQNLCYRGHEHLGVGVEENYRVPRRSALQSVESDAKHHADNNSNSCVPESSESGVLSRYRARSGQEADHQGRPPDPYQDVGDKRVKQPCADVFWPLEGEDTALKKVGHENP